MWLQASIWTFKTVLLRHQKVSKQIKFHSMLFISCIPILLGKR